MKVASAQKYFEMKLVSKYTDKLLVCFEPNHQKTEFESYKKNKSPVKINVSR